jgi:transposase InsO family protein
MGLYQQALHKKRALDQSMSRKGNCLDNAVMENWFGIMKTEFFYQKKFEEYSSHLRQKLEEYIHYYNHDRIKQKLKGLSPVKLPNSIPCANLTKLSNYWGSVQLELYRSKLMYKHQQRTKS